MSSMNDSDLASVLPQAWKVEEKFKCPVKNFREVQNSPDPDT